jgi:2-octaprenyl-6-methoxyphenol hydroxylase
MDEAIFDVAVVGGGLNGPALALALAQAGLSVALVDARPAPARAEVGFDGRAYALAAASRRLLQAIGVWEGVEGRAQPILRIETRDGGGPAAPALYFDHAEIEEGPMGHLVEDRVLYAAFLAAMQAGGRIALHHGETVTAQDTGGPSATLTLASGRQIRARLIAGCDGRGSATAGRAGIRRQGWGYGQTALVTALAHERDHQGTAWQVFLPGGPLAVLPLAGGHHSSIVWSETAAQAEAVHARDDAGYLAALAPHVEPILGPVTLAGARFTYPLTLSLAERFVAPRVALVGDAAHGVHPIAGQGLNLGLRDVAALAEVVALAARRGEDIGAADVLERYQRWRRFDATALALGMDTVNRVFSSASPLVRLARGAGMRAVAAAPALRRAFIREAAGLSGDLPRLMTGRPI